MVNFTSVDLIELMKFGEFGNPINAFRKETLSLRSIDILFSLGVTGVKDNLRIPISYSWYVYLL